MKMRCVQQILVRVFLGARAARFPSPQPSPQGRGSSEVSLSSFPCVPALQNRWRPFPLSLGERAGVRGKVTSGRQWLPKYHYSLTHTPGAAVPALLTLWLVLAALATTHSAAADFSSVVAFELGEGEFRPGDSITIQRVSGTSPTIQIGRAHV